MDDIRQSLIYYQSQSMRKVFEQGSIFFRSQTMQTQTFK